MKKKSCVFVLQHNEQYYLPLWVKWYGKTFLPEDMYILAHNTTEPMTTMLKRAEADGINVENLNTEVIFDHNWLNQTVHAKQRELLNKYEWVLYTDCDELIEPIEGTLSDWIDNATEDAYRCDGWDIHENKMYRSIGFCKTLLTKIPLTYVYGYHQCVPEFPINGNLRLYHIHKMNFEESWARNQRVAAEKWDQYALDNGLGKHNNIAGEQDFKDWWVRDVPSDEYCIAVPEELVNKILN